MATDSQTTTTTAMMMTTTNKNNTDTNTTQRKRTPEQERLRDWWEDRVTGALFRQLKRKVRAANALFGTQEWVSVNQNATWFMQHY